MAFICIDVGSKSIRCSIIQDSRILITKYHPIKVWNYNGIFYEQSSRNIWNSIEKTIKYCLNNINNNINIIGIGFTATCSLVVVGKDNNIISVSNDYSSSDYLERDIIMWMDHRANNETNIINSSNHSLLKYLGGKINIEMQIPKLLWLKKNKIESYNNALYFMDLVDYLTYKASNKDYRSICTTTCKWLFDNGKWNSSFLISIGLDDLLRNNYKRIGNPDNICQIGESIGYIDSNFAYKLGISTSTIIACGMIDAHAGSLAMLFTPISKNIPLTLSNVSKKRIAILCGTSACHMVFSPNEIFIKGIWGPYKSALIPNYYLHEGGQSTCGSLLDHIITSHKAYSIIESLSKENNTSIFDILNNEVFKYKNNSIQCTITKDIHILPYFHGNRSPYSDSSLTGVIFGLTLDSSLYNLVLYYYSCIQALCYESKQIIEHIENSEYYSFDTIILAGGLSNNPLFIQELADITQKIVIKSKEQAMLMGTAIVTSVAVGKYSSIHKAAINMTPEGIIYKPNTSKIIKNYHNVKYSIFCDLYKQQLLYKQKMKNF